MSQPEESREKSAKVDDILLKPVLKDLDELREGAGEDPRPHKPGHKQHKQHERERGGEDT
jgi:hypothetical protein